MRSPLREVSANLRSPATGGRTAPNSTGKAGFDPDATPPPAVWQSGDDYKFVEEDDDEVMFRVRDSGVLRSLALPDITVATPPALLVAGESTHDKQVPTSPSPAPALCAECHLVTHHACPPPAGKGARAAPEVQDRFGHYPPPPVGGP